MRKAYFLLTLLVLVLSVYSGLHFNLARAAEPQAVINFFYSETCPHCHEESLFLDELEELYGERLIINRYSINKLGTADILKNLAEQYGAEDVFGRVPITFVGKNYYVGFDSAEGTGQKITASVETQLALLPEPEPESASTEENGGIQVPILGEIDSSHYSLPALAVFLGTLDGLNVCSLGALILVLGLTLELKSRKRILLYGGLFLLTTVIVYGILINLWHQLFVILQHYLGILGLMIGVLGIVGGIFFFREFLRMRKVGLVCKATGASFVDRVMKMTETAFAKPDKIFYLVLAIVLFAAVVVVVEFPCSAAVPVAFAGIMADAGVSGSGQFLLLALYLLFYLLDELLIFGIAAWRMKVVLTSPNFTIWATFIESIFLFALGFYYLGGLI
ncbi:MAG: thioredoxin family protein [Candidatus Colwellbacteria bacterium]|nr:thioredoxin family protein [Candidatus Colwellbacteria bacterium]